MRTDHWDGVYRSKASDAVSWFQASPTVSLELLDGIGLAGNT